jgi:carbamate kinase
VSRPGGGSPLAGVEAVIDKDRAGALLAIDLSAELYVMATDVEGVYLDWGGPGARLIGNTTPDELSQYSFPAGSMGPKVEAARHFTEETGNRSAIGSLNDILSLVDGTAGTQVRKKGMS